MANLVERKLPRAAYEQRLSDMLALGLTGLGVVSEECEEIVGRLAATSSR